MQKIFQSFPIPGIENVTLISINFHNYTSARNIFVENAISFNPRNLRKNSIFCFRPWDGKSNLSIQFHNCLHASAHNIFVENAFSMISLEYLKVP